MKGEERLGRLMDDIAPITSHYRQIALRRRCSKWPRQERSKQERRHKWCWPLLIPRPPCYTFCLLNITPHHEKRCWGNWCASQARPRQGRLGWPECGQLVGLSLEPRLWEMLPSAQGPLLLRASPALCAPSFTLQTCPIPPPLSELWKTVVAQAPNVGFTRGTRKHALRSGKLTAGCA